MESVLGRYRNLIVLVGVLFAQVLGLAVQVKRPTESGSTHLIRIWAVGAVTPLEKVLVRAQTSTGNLWHNYLYLRGVRAENRALKQEIERMRLEQARMTQDADQAHRLQALLAFKEQFISQTLPAQVIGSAGSELSRSVYIDKGSRHGVKRDMAVITKDGIVGKVLYVYPSTSLVLLIDDQTSGVGAILEKERLQGILRGTPSGEVVLEKVMSDETVPVGEKVLTSGGDGIFPKGLPVGRVTKVTPGSDLFFNIRVRPAVNLSQLEEVLVITKIDERQARTDQSGPMRAIDILAERLPSVPPKPENATDVAGSKPATLPAGSANAAAVKTASPNPKSATDATTSGGTGISARPAAAPAAESKPKPVPGAATPDTKPKPATGPAVAVTKPGATKATASGGTGVPTRPAAAPQKKAVTSGTSSASAPPAATPATGAPANTKPSIPGAESPSAGAAKKPAPKPAPPSVSPNPQPAAQDPPH